jgi:cysteinylglycine-S-conjugate dipeptidase
LTCEAGLRAETRVVSPDVPPFVSGSYDGAGPDASTLVIYAHYDVQPPGSDWTTHPWKAISKADGRIYGRGTTDDKGAIVAILTSVRPWMKSGRLPVNLRFLVEGGEEIGSPGLSKFIEDNRHWFGKPCALALADTENLRTGLPCLPAVLFGIEDPNSATHAPNESLDVADWRKLIVSLACFYPFLVTDSQLDQ